MVAEMLLNKCSNFYDVKVNGGVMISKKVGVNNRDVTSVVGALSIAVYAVFGHGFYPFKGDAMEDG